MATIDVLAPRPHWRFWLEWMGMNVAAIVVYLVVMIPVGAAFAALGPAYPDEPRVPLLLQITVSLSAILLGLTLGMAQWLVLRKHLKHIGGWVLATTIGYATPFIAPPLLQAIEPGWPIGMLILGLTGLVLGVLQWLVLRNRIANAGWWIPISVGGWSLAFALTGIAYLTSLYVEPFDMFAAAFVPIAVAGVGLAWMTGSG